MLFSFGVLSSVLTLVTLSRFETDAQGITRSLLGKKRRLNWREIEGVEHRPPSNSLCLRSQSGNLRILRQIQGFVELLEIVQSSVPTSAIETPLSVPFIVPASWTVRAAFAGLTSFVFLFAFYVWRVGTDWPTAALLFGLGALNGVLLGWYASLRFEFDNAEFRIVYPLRSTRYRIADLSGVALVQTDLDIAVALKFGGKTVELSDNQITIAPERVYESLVAAYGLSESTNVDTGPAPKQVVSSVHSEHR